MSQLHPERKSQTQENVVKDNTIEGNLTFAPQQIETYIETQIVEISAEKVTQQQLIKSSPYKGLKRFNFGDREYFFGRDALITKLFKAVNKSSFSLVLGASGSGKSSVVRAGLIPELKKSLASQEFYDFIFTPNQDPFKSLYRCLLSEEKDYHFSESDIDFVREGKPNALPQLVNKLKSNGEKWFLFIDQFEQLFTICIDLEKRKNFIEGIVHVARKGDSSVIIVLAMRSDFLEQFSFYPSLGAIANQNNIHLVTEMYPDELRLAIEQPAAKHGVVFEKGLVEQIVKEVEGQKGYLPLLQYTLDLLWEKECTTKSDDSRFHFHIEDRTLNKVSYEALGRARGALQKRVDEIYKDICQKNEDGELITKQIFLKLVNIVESESGRKAVSKRAYCNEFVGEPVKNTLKTLIDESLLVSGYEYSSEENLLIGNGTSSIENATIELSHEILLSSWDKLKLWLEEEQEAIILKSWLASETRRWLEVLAEDESKANDELLKGSRLAQIVTFRDKNAFEKLGGLIEEENEFISASVEWQEYLQKEEEERKKRELEKERKARKAAQLTTGVSILATIFVGTLGWIANNQRIETLKNEISTQAQSSRTLFLLNQNSINSLIEGLRAAKKIKQIRGVDDYTQIKVSTALIQALSQVKEKNRLLGHTNHVQSVAFSPNGKIIASASGWDQTVRLWNLEGKELLTIPDHTNSQSVAFSPDGKTIVTPSIDNTAKLWNLEGKELLTLRGHREPVESVAFSPDGKTIATGSEDKTVKLWNLEGKELLTIPDHFYSSNSIAFSPDGKTIATSSRDKTVKLWNLEGKELLTLRGHTYWVDAVAFSPDGKTIATGSQDKTVKLWNLEGKELLTLRGHTYWVDAVAFSPDGKTIATGSQDKTVKLWNLEGKELLTLRGHTAYVTDVAFSPDGKTLASASYDNTVKLWNLEVKGSQTINGHVSIVDSLAFSPDGKTIATGSHDNTVKLHW